MARTPTRSRSRSRSGPDPSIIKPEERDTFAGIQITDFDSLASFLSTEATEELKDTNETRLRRTLRIGRAVDAAAQAGLTTNLTPEQQARLEFSPAHRRVCRRIFLGRAHIAEDQKWYEDNASRLGDFKPRKGSGIDYIWACMRAKQEYDKLRTANPNASDDTVFELTAGKLAGPSAGEREGPTAGQQTDRLLVIVAYLFRQASSARRSALPFSSLETLERWIAGVPHDPERDAAALAAIMQTPFANAEVPEAFFDRDVSDADANLPPANPPPPTPASSSRSRNQTVRSGYSSEGTARGALARMNKTDPAPLTVTRLVVGRGSNWRIVERPVPSAESDTSTQS